MARDLSAILRRIDGRGFKAYRDIEGTYDLGDWTLHIDHVQSDPFAPPSRVRAWVPASVAQLPDSLYETKARRVGLEDYLTRAIHAACGDRKRGGGTGHSGIISIHSPGQEVLERSAMVVDNEGVEARMLVGLPARGRRIMAREAEEMLLRELPEIVMRSLVYSALQQERLEQFVEAAEDASFLRERLPEMGLVAFIGDGAILPRRSGVDDTVMTENAVPFSSPDSLRVEVHLPNQGKISGMGVREGVTLIVGGGYHGKSTLLKALERGVYNHIPGDGREWVLTVENAVKIRAEDGRSISGTDISPFIDDLPRGMDTLSFSSQDASGSTSQAANIMEALEAGTKLLLVDEDTSATNFMIRDQRMQELVHRDKEPITPFIDQVRRLYEERGVSTVLVMGGSGDYFDVTDRVIMMEAYVPRDVTQEAKNIASRYVTGRAKEASKDFSSLTSRAPLPQSFDASRGKRSVKISPKGLHSILFGTTQIDLGAVEQLVDPGQVNAIGELIHLIGSTWADGKRSLPQLLDEAEALIDGNGLDAISTFLRGDFARPRRYEITAAINRMRSLRVRAV